MKAGAYEIVCGAFALTAVFIALLGLCRTARQDDDGNHNEEGDHVEALAANIQTAEEDQGMEQAAAAVGSPGRLAGGAAGAKRHGHELPAGSVDHRGDLPPMNKNGEVAGFGARWACRRYGAEGHSYNDCPECHDNFRLLFAKGGTA